MTQRPILGAKERSGGRKFCAACGAGLALACAACGVNNQPSSLSPALRRSRISGRTLQQPSWICPMMRSRRWTALRQAAAPPTGPRRHRVGHFARSMIPFRGSGPIPPWSGPRFSGLRHLRRAPDPRCILPREREHKLSCRGVNVDVNVACLSPVDPLRAHGPTRLVTLLSGRQ
jgi:hypothetical protein